MSHDDIDDTPIAVSNLDTPTADPIAQVLAAHNHYTVLSLPLPTENVAGEVLWDGTSEDVKRAYKKWSLLTHPDKNASNSDAPQAFEAVKKAFTVLYNDATRYDYAKQIIASHKSSLPVQAGWTPRDNITDTIKQQLAEQRTKQQIHAKQFDSFQTSVLSRMKERQVAASEQNKRKQAELQRTAEKKQKLMEQTGSDSEEDRGTAAGGKYAVSDSDDSDNSDSDSSSGRGEESALSKIRALKQQQKKRR